MKRRAEEEPISFDVHYHVPGNRLKKIYTLCYLCQAYEYEGILLGHKDGPLYRELFGFIPGGIYFNMERLDDLYKVFTELEIFSAATPKIMRQNIWGLQGQLVKAGKYYALLSPYLQLHLPEAMLHAKTELKKIVGITVTTNIIGPAYSDIPLGFLTHSPFEDMDFENLKLEGIKFVANFNSKYAELAEESIYNAGLVEESNLYNREIWKNFKELKGASAKKSMVKKLCKVEGYKIPPRIILDKIEEIEITKEYLTENFENFTETDYMTSFDFDDENYKAVLPRSDAPWLSLEPGKWSKQADVELESLQRLLASESKGFIEYMEDIELPEILKDVKNHDEGIRINLTGFETQFMKRIPEVNVNKWDNISYMFSFLIGLIDKMQQ